MRGPALQERSYQSLFRQSICPGTRWETEPGSHLHQVRERLGLHFLHDLAPVRFHRDLADVEFSADLFVQHARHHQRHDLPFTSRQ